MLFIYYSSVQAIYEQDPWVSWAWQDQQEVQLGKHPVLLSQLAEQLPTELKTTLLHRIAIILPSEAVSFYSVELPQVQKKHLLKAVPYALEEKLAEDVEQLHFALGIVERDQPVQAAVIAKSLLQQCLAQLKSHHLYPIYMTSEIALLPSLDSVPQIFSLGEKFFVQLEKDLVVAVAQEQLAMLLPNLLPADVASRLVHSVRALSLRDLCEKYHHQISERRLLNVLQGHFKQRSQKTTATGNYSWRSVAVLLVLALLIKASLYAGEVIYYGHQANVLKQQSEALYKNYFPKTKQIHDVKRELQAKLRLAHLGNNQAGFLALLAKAGKPLADLTQHNALHLDIQSLSYDRTQGQLRIDLYVPDFPALDSLKQAVERAGLVMVIDAANQDKDRVRARIKLGMV